MQIQSVNLISEACKKTGEISVICTILRKTTIKEKIGKNRKNRKICHVFFLYKNTDSYLHYGYLKPLNTYESWGFYQFVYQFDHYQLMD